MTHAVRRDPTFSQRLEAKDGKNEVCVCLCVYVYVCVYVCVCVCVCVKSRERRTKRREKKGKEKEGGGQLDVQLVRTTYGERYIDECVERRLSCIRRTRVYVCMCVCVCMYVCVCVCVCVYVCVFVETSGRSPSLLPHFRPALLSSLFLIRTRGLYLSPRLVHISPAPERD